MSIAMQQCPRCGASNPINAKFCQNCGQGLVSARIQPQQQSQPNLPSNFVITEQNMPASAEVKTKRGCLNRVSGTFLALGLIAILLSICGALSRMNGTKSPSNNQSAGRPTFTPTTGQIEQTASKNGTVNLVATSMPAEVPAEAPVDNSSSVQAAVAAPAGTGPTFAQICKVDEHNLTEIQLKSHADSFAGQTFTNWQGYVYDVQEQDGRYTVELADDTGGFIWTRDMEVQGIPAEVAEPLLVKQRVLISGRISEVQVNFGVACNPIIIDSASLIPQEGGLPLPPPPAGELTYTAVCGIDEHSITAVQLSKYAEQFSGQSFQNWQGYVYDVGERDGQYVLQLADDKRGLIWARTMEVQGIPPELAAQLNVEQPVLVSGRIAAVDVTFGTLCNPVNIDNATVTAQ